MSKPALQLLKSINLHTPADGCVICRHKDREHRGSCDTCPEFGRICLEFVSAETARQIIFDAIVSVNEVAAVCALTKQSRHLIHALSDEVFTTGMPNREACDAISEASEELRVILRCLPDRLNPPLEVGPPPLLAARKIIEEERKRCPYFTSRHKFGGDGYCSYCRPREKDGAS